MTLTHPEHRPARPGQPPPSYPQDNRPPTTDPTTGLRTVLENDMSTVLRKLEFERRVEAAAHFAENHDQKVSS